MTMIQDSFDTLVSVTRWRADTQPDRTAYTFLHRGETVGATLTYGELDRQARAIAAHLQTVVREGDRVLLLFPPGIEFIPAFLGCLYAKAIAVPAYPPRNARMLGRLKAIAQDSGAAAALSLGAFVDRPIDDADLARIDWIAVDRIAPERAEDWQAPDLTGDTLAFLQYTSGSTGTPKGVMVSHGNILHNERTIQAGFGHTAESAFVGWLPLFHDMGLIGNTLQPLWLGIPCTLMSPLDFLQRPVRWLQAIGRYGATTSGGPNFAYELCIDKVTPEQLAELDLSRWKVAFNGAEPIRAETLQRFAEKFAPCGFKPEAFFPCFGGAEPTLFVAGGPSGRPMVTLTVDERALGQHRVEPVDPATKGGLTLTSCGRTWLETRVAIVDPETLRRCPPDRVGEIWVSSPSVTQGYWNRPELTAQTFGGRIADTGEGPFLRTGDLGFVHADELFVTGRIKDLITIRGRNLYPHEIERTVEKSHPAIRPGCTAAFGTGVDNEQRLVVMAEIERRLKQRDQELSEGNRAAMEERLDTFSYLDAASDEEAVLAAIRRSVEDHYDVAIHEVVLVKATTIPKTSSGKIKRYACRDNFLSGDLHVLSRS